MFHFFKILVIIALIDYIIYNYYKKCYKIQNNNTTNDIYKYRIITYSIYWFFLLYLLYFNSIEFNYTKILYINFICLAIYLFTNMYFIYKFNNFPTQIIFIDIFYGLLMTNFIIFIYLNIII